MHGQYTTKLTQNMFPPQLLDAQYIQMQDLAKAAAGNGPSKKVTLYYIDLGWVTRVQVTPCQDDLS